MTQRKAFTLIELLVAIGIIAVLIGLVIFALRSAGNQSRSNATRVTMENLKSMLGEMELATKFSVPPLNWYRYLPVTSGTLQAPRWHTYEHAAADPVDFYRIIDRVDPTNAATAMRYTLSPSLVTSEARDAGLDELEIVPVWNTVILMNQLRTLPVNRAALDRLPPEQLLSVTTLASRSAYGDPAPGNPGYFAGLTSQILLDGWRNPVIFVPGTTGLLVGRPYNAATPYTVGQYVLVGITTATPTSYKCIQNVQGVIPPNATYWQPMPAIVAPNNRPFFASAGPDGDFSKGDDNIYSFEQ